MRNKCSVWLWLMILGAVCGAAQGTAGGNTADQLAGTWVGTWDTGGSGGGFELTFDKGKDGALAGRVAVSGEPSYKATLKALSFDGKKMAAKYDFTPDDQAEVVLAGSFDGSTASGTWSLRAKAGDSEVASGTWTVTR